MAIDPRISLAVRAPNIPQLMQQMQNLSASKQKQQQSAALFPSQLEQAGQATDINQANLDANALQVKTNEQNQNLLSINAYAPEAKKFIQAGDSLGLLTSLNRRNETLISQGKTQAQRQETLDAIDTVTNGNMDQLLGDLDTVEREVFSRGLSTSNLTSGQRDFNSITSDFSPEELAKAQRVKARIVAPAGSSAQERIATDRNLTDQVADSQGQIESTKASSKTTAIGISARNQGYIDSGIEAADQVAVLTKSLDLLKTVKTGGFSNAALSIQNFLGVTGGDELELSSNMGKALLSQLKPIFGSAFTEGEGDRLTAIEANFGKSTAGNIRLIENTLKTVERSARRGLAAAKEVGDTFTVNEIQSLLDEIKTTKEDTAKPKSRFTVVVE